MGCVRQDIFTFAGTIEENIRLRTEGLSKDDVIEASGHANAKRFIEALPKKYDTDVQERGTGPIDGTAPASFFCSCPRP